MTQFLTFLDRVFDKGDWSAQTFLTWAQNVLGTIHIGLATSIIVGGSERFRNPTLEPLRDIAQGQVWLWGFLIFISAVLIFSPFKVAEIFGLWLGMCWHFFWMGCVTVAVYNDKNAAATSIPMYGGLALFCTVLLTAKVLDAFGKE